MEKKPYKMSVKDFLISKTARDLEIGRDVVEQVIMSQYKKLNRSIRTQDMLEVSGFGTFYLSQTKLGRRIERHKKHLDRIRQELEEATDVEKITKMADKVEYAEQVMEYFKSRLKPTNGQLQENPGRMEESPLSPEGVKGANKGDIIREAKYLPPLSL